ncbi:unnamed protein product [Urochloa decumbens]|uniref:MATH domain-containing protein n=1 Tax=Urochloa decumbens TaxID=240449 RepID=A0ABC9GCI3_9POAL
MPSGPAPTLLPFGRLAPGALSGSATRARQATGTHLHRIDGYSLVDGTVSTGTAIRSSRFHVGGHQWELLYYPNGVNHLHRGFVSVALSLASAAGEDAAATASYRKIQKKKTAALFLVKDDRLTVRCDVAVLVTETRPRNRWFMQLDRAINGFR